jgi:hypothetical protein
MAAKLGAFREAREEKTKRTLPGARQQESAAVNLDRLIHERTRLAIISALAVNTSLTFSELKESQRSCAKARRRRLRLLLEIIRRANAKNRVPPYAFWSPGSREILESHGSFNSGDTRALIRIVGAKVASEQR